MIRSSVAVLFLSACAPSYDEALLEEFRGALPQEENLQAKNPSSAITALGDTAIFPASSIGIVLSINVAIGTIVQGLGFVTSLSPTQYNAQTEEFVWGPWDDQEFGTVAVYVKRESAESDFAFSYALLRGTTEELESMQPVILGVASPDPEHDGRGSGVTLWDAEANRAFLEANGQPVDQLERGRFAALYARGPDETTPENDVAIVVSAWRDYQGAQDNAEPLDLDYLHGHVSDAASGRVVDFLDYHGNVDVDEWGDGQAEDVDVRMAFIDRGIGRAQAGATGGSLPDGEAVEVTECWDDLVKETYLEAERIDVAGEVAELYQIGSESDCAAPFQETLEALEIPTILDVDPELLGALDALTEGGVDAVLAAGE